MKRGQTGFSLIELLVTVAIILILASVAIPHYLRSKLAANEANAVGCMRTVTSGLILYVANYPEIGYPASLLTLGDGGTPTNCQPNTAPSSSNACIIDNSLASGTKGGYTFTYTRDMSQVPSPSYSLHADPISRGVTGTRSFLTDVPGVIHWNATQSATDSDASIPM